MLGNNAMAHAAFQEAVKAFFKKLMNIARACLDFHQHCQGQSETVSEFVSALRELALDCDFPVDYLKRELALQILSGCRSTKARERMLLAAIDLDEYVQILESDESLQEDSRIFAAAAGSHLTPTVTCWRVVRRDLYTRQQLVKATRQQGEIQIQ